MTSAWKRRLTVAGLQLAAVGFFFAYFMSVRPKAEAAETTLGDLIAAQKEHPSGDRLVAIDTQFREMKRHTSLSFALLSGAFVLGVAAVATGGIWGLIEQRRLGATVQAATKT